MKARISIGPPADRDFPRGLLGHFIENMAHCIYKGGLMAEHGEQADVAGARKRMVDLLQAVRPSVIRWPGGLFADGYDWTNGVGPVQSRKPTPNRYWGRYGPLFGPRDVHTFGTLEFAALCERVNADVYINVNLGTGTPESAAQWAEYCTGGPDTGFGSQRISHGRVEPVPVRLWGIGNEIYGFWALGHSDADAYARRYLQFRQTMEAPGDRAEYVAVGADLDWPDWNVRLLDKAGDKVDVLSIHIYLPSSNKPQYLRYSHTSSTKRMLSILAAPEEWAARLDAITARIHDSLGPIPLKIALDEWGLWWWVLQCYRANFRMRDAVSLAGALHLMAERPQVVWANYAQFINVLGLVQAWPNVVVPSPLYHMFQLYGRFTRQKLVGCEVHGPTFDAPELGDIAARSGLPCVMAMATADPDGRATLFLVNRDLSNDIDAEIQCEGLQLEPCAVVLDGPGPLAANTRARPTAVRPLAAPWKPGEPISLPPCSITVLGADGDDLIY